jgi:hypothetical protein
MKADVESGVSNQVPSDGGSVLTGCSTFKYTAASFDYGRRTDVVLVAHDENRINAFAMGQFDGLPKHLGGVAFSPERR